jgi:hypothetical protein
MTVVLSDAGLIEFSSATISISPNPFSGTTNIQLEGLEIGNQLNIVALNSLGQKVADVYHGKATENNQSILWTANNSLSKGVYLLQINHGGKEIIRRVVRN